MDERFLNKDCPLEFNQCMPRNVIDVIVPKDPNISDFCPMPILL